MTTPAVVLRNTPHDTDSASLTVGSRVIITDDSVAAQSGDGRLPATRPLTGVIDGCSDFGGASWYRVLLDDGEIYNLRSSQIQLKAHARCEQDVAAAPRVLVDLDSDREGEDDSPKIADNKAVRVVRPSRRRRRVRVVRAGKRLSARNLRNQDLTRIRLWRSCARCQQLFSVECDVRKMMDGTHTKVPPFYCTQRCAGDDVSTSFDELDLPVAVPQLGGAQDGKPHLRETRIIMPSPNFALGQKAVSHGAQSVVVRGALFDGSGDIHVLSSRLITDSSFERDVYPPLPQTHFESSNQGALSHTSLQWTQDAQQALMKSLASSVNLNDTVPLEDSALSYQSKGLDQIKDACPFPELQHLWQHVICREKSFQAANTSALEMAVKQEPNVHPGMLWRRFESRHASSLRAISTNETYVAS